MLNEEDRRSNVEYKFQAFLFFRPSIFDFPNFHTDIGLSLPQVIFTSMLNQKSIKHGN